MNTWIGRGYKTVFAILLTRRSGAVIGSLGVAVSVFAFPALAVEGSPERETASTTASSPDTDRAGRRIYSGGRDEQDLKPQSTLPSPSRAIDGGAVPSAVPRAEPAPD